MGRLGHTASCSVTPPPPADPPPDLSDSPLYLLAVLVAARRSRDRALERVTRRRLAAFGVRVAFGDDRAARRPKGGTRG